MSVRNFRVAGIKGLPDRPTDEAVTILPAVQVRVGVRVGVRGRGVGVGVWMWMSLVSAGVYRCLWVSLRVCSCL